MADEPDQEPTAAPPESAAGPESTSGSRPGFPMTPEREALRARARELRAEDPGHWTYPRIGEELGVPAKTVGNWLNPPTRDRSPRKRSKPRPPKASPENVKARTRILEATLAELLVFPAVPSAMLVEDPGRTFLIAHFTQAGPRTAHTLAVASENSPELRAWLEGLTKGSLRATIAFAVLGYAGPPILWLFGMQQLAVGLSSAGGLDEQALAAMFTPPPANGYAQSPPQPDTSPADTAPPSETPPAG